MIRFFLIAIISTMFAVVALPDFVTAETSIEPVVKFEQLKIVSTYADPSSKDYDQQLKWSFQFLPTNECRVFLNNESNPRLVLHYTSDRRLQKVVDVEQAVHNRLASKKPKAVFLSHGYPVPYDDIPFQIDSATVAVTDQRTIAGMVFTNNLTLNVHQADLQVVAAAGFISSGLMANLPPGKLYWVELSDQDNNLIIRQLWHSTLGWWLYEQTAERKSWLQSFK